MNARDIILRPIVSEKSMGGMRDGRYSFVVHRNANKIEIRQAVSEIWGVDVASVHTMRYRGKVRRVNKSEGRRPDWKKAVVTLRPGERIPFFEGML